MKEIAEGIILTLVPEDKIKRIIDEINTERIKEIQILNMIICYLLCNVQDPKFDENIKIIIDGIKDDLNKSLKKMNSLNNSRLLCFKILNIL